jgi:thioesterase domain-containing protein/acyl carrier protein
VAYIVPNPGRPLSVVEMRAYLKQTLPDYMLPSGLVALESLPLTPNGKVDRKALPKPELSKASSGPASPPRDELETSLTMLWQEILGAPVVNITDNFFDLGGHSLMAVRLVNEIEKLTGVEIPLTALFQEATIERLASYVRGTASVPQAIVHQIQAGGALPPFFAAVLAGLNSLGYVPLAKHLGAEQPFYTLQSPGPGPNSTGKPYTIQEYEAVAAEYVRAMRMVRPHGPYSIGGTCEGARIAFEMARILEAEGETVALLAIIDTWVIENTQNRWLWKIYYYCDQLRRLSRQSWSSRMAAIRKAVRNRLQWWTRSKSAPRRSEWIQTYWPGEDFVPAQVHSRITVFKIPKQPFYYRPDPLLGWGSRTTSGVTTELVPHGKHLLLLREPYVRELAAALSRTLKRTGPDLPRHARLADQPESVDAAAVSR